MHSSDFFGGGEFLLRSLTYFTEENKYIAYRLEFNNKNRK